MGKIDMTGWTPEQIKDYEAASADAASAESALLDAFEARRAAEAAPAHLIAAKRAEAAAARAEVSRLAQEAQAEIVYEKACVEYGGSSRVAIVRHVEGAIVMRAMTAREIDEQASRGAELKVSDREAIGREGIRGTVLYPPGPTFDDLLERYHGLWGTLAEARDALVSGLRADLSKKG